MLTLCSLEVLIFSEAGLVKILGSHMAFVYIHVYHQYLSHTNLGDWPGNKYNCETSRKYGAVGIL